MFSSLMHKLPLAVVGLVLLIAVMTIYFRSKNVTRSEFFKIFKSTPLFKARILAFVLIFTFVFGIANHFKSKQFVTAVVALNYSEASQAHNSNGTRYNMAEITCDEVLEKAIEMGALENVTAKQLKECLYVYPYIQGDVGHESSYHISTEFVVEYRASKHTAHLDSENVIKLITLAYKEYYVGKYTDSFTPTLPEDKPDFSEMEYMDIVVYLNKEANAVLTYLYGLAQSGPGYVTKNDTTFPSIAGKVYQFKETQIEENLRSLILQHGIVRDKSGYTNRLTYQNKNTDFDRRKNSASFKLCNEAIAMYAEDMTRIVLVPTWDEGGKYYMGRTKVGIDELSVMATVYSDRVASNEKEIMDNTLIISKIQNANNNDAAKKEADALIESIDKNIDAFAVEAVAAGREYSNYRMNQCIALSISGNSLLNEAKSIFVFAVLAYIAALMYAASRKFPKA